MYKHFVFCWLLTLTALPVHDVEHVCTIWGRPDTLGGACNRVDVRAESFHQESSCHLIQC